MRILFLSHYFPPEGNAPASRTHANCRHWVESGHEVTVITCAPNVPDGVVYEGYRNRLCQTEWIDGIRVVRVWTYVAPNRGTFRRILNYLSYLLAAVFFGLFQRRPDILIATSPQFFCGWAGLILSWLRRLPFVLEIRDIWPESIQAVGAMQNRRVLKVLEWLEHKLYAGARHIVTVGEGYRARLLEKGVDPERISIVMNGVDRNLFSPREKDRDLLARYQLQDKFVCSYIGTIGMASALEVVLRAARLLKEQQRNEITFLLVGDGATREELETQARAEKLDNVIFTGRQDKDLMPAFLSISDACLVHLKKTDLFTTVVPSKIFEAAGMARAIIMAVQGGAADIVRESGGGVFMEPEDENELVALVSELADNPEECRRLGASGQSYVTEKFDRQRLAEDYLTLLQGLCPDTRTGQ